MCVAVMASWAAMQLATSARHAKRPAARWAALGSGALALGAGVWSMHFIGMLAMRMDARLAFDPRGFAASIVLAVALAVLALWIRSGLAHRLRLRARC